MADCSSSSATTTTTTTTTQKMRHRQDPMYSCHAHLLAFDLLALRSSSSPSSSSAPTTTTTTTTTTTIPALSWKEQPLFSRRGRPVYRVEVLGIVVSLERRENYLRFVLDDGTGCVPCILWLNLLGRQLSVPHRSIRSVENEVCAELGLADAAKVMLSALLRVRGRLSSFRAQIQVTVASIAAELNPNAETLHWLDCMSLGLHHYDLQFPP